MLLELNPFQTELFCIARPRVLSEASFFGDFGDFLHFRIIFAMGFSRFWVARVVIFGYFGSPAAPFGGSGPISTIFGFVVILGALRHELTLPF